LFQATNYDLYKSSILFQGLCIAIPGPTFLSPVTELQADTSPISSIYAARSSGYLIGSIIGMYDNDEWLFTEPIILISVIETCICFKNVIKGSSITCNF
jgi:hypothetical protein